MANCSAQEQLMLELVNRARMNPAAEAARFGVALNQGLPAGTISSAPKQVLAMNDFLVTAARQPQQLDGHQRSVHAPGAGELPVRPYRAQFRHPHDGGGLHSR